MMEPFLFLVVTLLIHGMLLIIEIPDPLHVGCYFWSSMSSSCVRTLFYKPNTILKWPCLFFSIWLYTARGRLEGNHEGTSALLSGPVAPDPVLHPGCYSARTPTNRPRIGPNAMHILERGQKGVVGELLKLDGVSVMPVPKQSKCDWLTWSISVSYARKSSSVLSWNGISVSSCFIFWFWLSALTT